jgi:hypothetical protein
VRIRRTRPVDEVTVDGETVVMVGDRVVLLSPLAAFAWSVLSEADWTSAPDLTAQLVAVFGAPDDPGGAVFALVSGLFQEGLVEVRDWSDSE